MAEISGYHRLKRILPKGTFFQRIETMAGAGIPDLYICCQGKSSWVELKETVVTKDGRVKIKHIRPAQRAWARQATAAGADVYMYVKVGKSYFLVLPSAWPILVEGISVDSFFAFEVDVLRCLVGAER